MSLGEFLLANAPTAFPGWYSRLREALFGPLVEDWAAGCRGRRVLDWGTASGELARALAAAAERQVDAVDESDHLLLLAEDQARQHGLGGRVRFRLREPDAPFPFDGDYDEVCSVVVRHGRPAALAERFAEMHDLLAQGGRLRWAELRPDALPDARTLARVLREVELLPGWLPPAIFEGAWDRTRRGLPDDEAVQAAVRQSPFGLPAERRTRDLHVGGQSFANALGEWTFEREDVVSRRLAAGEA